MIFPPMNLLFTLEILLVHDFFCASLLMVSCHSCYFTYCAYSPFVTFINIATPLQNKKNKAKFS